MVFKTNETCQFVSFDTPKKRMARWNFWETVRLGLKTNEVVCGIFSKTGNDSLLIVEIS